MKSPITVLLNISHKGCINYLPCTKATREEQSTHTQKFVVCSLLCPKCQRMDDNDDGDDDDYLLSTLFWSICCSMATFIFKCFYIIAFRLWSCRYSHCHKPSGSTVCLFLLHIVLLYVYCFLSYFLWITTTHQSNARSLVMFVTTTLL